MYLYTINDYEMAAGPGDGWWVAVWGDTEDAAIAHAREVYTGDGPPDAPLYALSFEEEDAFIKAGVSLPSVFPCAEKRPQALRIALWRYDDEYTCSCCDMAAMHLEEYAVCQECDLCKVCMLEDDEAQPCVCNDGEWEDA